MISLLSGIAFAPALSAQQPPGHTNLEGHTAAVRAVAFSPTGKWLASGSSDKSVQLWNLAALKAPFTLFSGQNKGDEIRAIAFSADGKTLAAAGSGRIYLFNVQDAKSSSKLELGVGSFQSIAFSPNGKLLAASQGDAVTIWDAANGKVVKTISTDQNSLSGIAFSPDGKTLATGNNTPRKTSPRSIKFWDVESGKNTAIIPNAQRFGVVSVAYSPDGKFLASTGSDALGSGPVKNPPPPPPNSPDHDGEVQLWEPMTLKNLATLKGHIQMVHSVAFSPDGKILASGSKDHTIKLWNMTNHQCTATLTGHTSQVWSVAFSPDGKTLASGSGDKTIKLWNLGR